MLTLWNSPALVVTGAATAGRARCPALEHEPAYPENIDCLMKEANVGGRGGFDVRGGDRQAADDERPPSKKPFWTRRVSEPGSAKPGPGKALMPPPCIVRDLRKEENTQWLHT